MRNFMTSLSVLLLLSTPALADHDHSKKTKGKAEAAHAEHKHEHNASEMKDEMKMKADDHAGHGTMEHGQDQMAHDGKHMGSDHMGEGHMKGSKTMPADGAVLKSSPKMIGMNFGHNMMVEAITISTFTGEMIELDVSEVGETDHVMVKAPELQADDYIVDWRARGADGHIMSGSFGFTVE